MNDRFVLTLWTSDPDTARVADSAGIDRIGIDLERLGKLARQAGMGTWVSPHTLDDLERLRPAVTRAQLFARTDPLHDGTPGEVERALAAGADVLMLPMFRGADEVARYVELVGGRARVVGLLETAEAVADVEAVAGVPGLDELHIGINDLALSLGLPNRFWVLLDPAAKRVARAAAAAAVPLGLGGIGRVTDTTLPIPPDLIYAQYARLGATAALISRSFLAAGCDVATEVRHARARLAWWAGRPRAEHDRAARELEAALSAITVF